MCGIAGFVTAEGRLPDAAALGRLCSALAHRGPDGEGSFIDDRVALGHRRLSIIDVEGGRQPLSNEDGSLQVVFNGEIYNFEELAADLKRRGHVFRTRSDTEVMVHLYEEAGERMPEHLVGMFAIALWDGRRRELFLARDRFGEKPLYYTESVPGLRFAFASELKALATLDGFPRRVSPRAVAEFLNFSYVPDPQTIYESVRRLAPGERMTVGLDGAPRRSIYWRPSFDAGLAAEFDEAAGRVDELSAAAVRGQMISDVPLGAFLSGGVDSSTVVAHMARQAPDRVKTFSIGFTSRKFDELEYARLTAARYQTAHSEEVVTPRIEEMLGVLVRQYDEPFGDPSAIPTLYLARMTRRHVTVALSGDGADEVFGGYRRYAMALSEERARRALPAWVRRGVVAPLARVYPKLDFLPRFLRAKATLTGISLTHAESYFLAMSRFGDGGLEDILSPGLKRQLGGFSAMEGYTDRFRPWSDLEPLRQLQAVDFETYLPGDILVKVDRATMAYSLESRAPWLDHRLAGYACSLPAGFHLAGRAGKRLFKAVAARYLDAPILTRPKMGFSVPLAEWLRTSLRGLFEREVLAAEMDALVNRETVRRLWAQHQRGTRNHDGKLWNLLMLACWHQAHVAGRAVEEVTRFAD